MEKIRWGIIGCGDVCEKKSGPAFYKIEHSSLVAVMRRNAEKAKDYAQRHAVEHYYTDPELLINDPQVDIVYIATPPVKHKDYAIKVMQASKPVYVEKPMALNYDECIEMNMISAETKQKLFVAFYRRSLPYFLKVKELIDNNLIGNPLVVNVLFYKAPSKDDKDHQLGWRVQKAIAGGGYFYDLAPHTFDILDFLLGEIEEAKGFSTNLGKLYEVEDTVSAIFRFKSGVQGIGQWNFVASPTEERDVIEIIGTNGTISFSTFAFGPILFQTKAGITQFTPDQPIHIQQPLIQTIVDELRGVGSCPSTGITGARTSWVIDKIMRTL
jgi:predicted dehydrogenase